MQSNRVNGADSTSRFRGDVQGLRAIAVLSVVLYHAGVPYLTGGYIGVDVFFVISGFLITSHLMGSLRQSGRVRFASFYAKRARRILPASLFVLVASVAAALIWYPPLLMREVWTGAVATALYVPNMLFAAEGTNYLAESTPSLFQHYWSLGIEEQFYLLWPVILAGAFFWIKRPRAMFAAVLALVLVSFALCVVLTFRQQPWAFFLLPTRAWELGVGGLAAILLIYRPTPLRGAAAAILAWAGVLGIVGSAVLFTSALPFPGYWAAVPVLSTAAVIIGGNAQPAGGPQGLLSTRPMLFVGLISYSLYLVHWPLLMIPRAALGFEEELPLWATLALGAVSFPVAWLVYRFVEDPGRRRTRLAHTRPRNVLLVAGAGSLVAVLVATGAYVVSSGRSLASERAAPSAEVTVPPQFTDFVPSNLSPSLRQVSSDQPAIYADGCHLDFGDTAIRDCVYGDPSAPRIVLFGDSHAAQWFPALQVYADSFGYSLETHTKSSCPSIDAAVLRNDVPYEECTTWRNSVIDRIVAERPKMVVLANFGVARLQGVSSSNFEAAWSDALESTTRRVQAPVLLLADTPIMGGTPSVCLSAHLSDAFACGRSAQSALDQPARRAEERVSTETGIRRIDMTQFLCAESCEPIIGDTLVYRDSHHLTATFSRLLGPELAEMIGPVP